MTDIKEHITNEALRIVIGARRNAYGKPENNFQRICDMWQAYFGIKGWSLVKQGDFHEPQHVSLQPLDVAAMMRLMKEARLVETPDHLDSYQDIVGYALCGAEVAGVQVPMPETSLATWKEECQRLQMRVTELLAAGEDYKDNAEELSRRNQLLQQTIASLQQKLASADPAPASSQDDQASETTPAP